MSPAGSAEPGIPARRTLKYQKPVNFGPPPSNVLTIARHLIAKIH